MGISGRIAKAFQTNPITPVLAILILIAGTIALAITPKEEDPQIDVTMVDVFLSAPGLSVQEVEQQIAVKAETLLAQVVGVDQVYSVSSPGQAIVTVQFDVGIKRQEALVKAWDQVMTELSWPPHYGVQPAKVKARGINDVPIVGLTFWSSDLALGQTQLGQVATAVANVLQSIDGTRNIELAGYSPYAINVTLDPVKAAAFSVDIAQVLTALKQFSQQQQELTIESENKAVKIAIGQSLQTADDVKNLVVRGNGEQLVYLRDIAKVARTTAKPNHYVQMASANGEFQLHTAVTLSLAKQQGQNAIDVAEQVLTTVEQLRGTVIPDNVNYTITRNSGVTAQEKANTLIQKLLFATLAVVLLVLAFLGKRAALIVGIAVALTLLITLFSSWAWGFTLNRISLFALIFSIGILVDDAIVVVENIHRRQLLAGKAPLSQVIPNAVDEVGSSTILATFTVIAALLPMAFVSGLMGPYMSPIPVNASTGMLLSLLIAFTLTPWLALRLLQGQQTEQTTKHKDRIGDFAASILRRFITAKHALKKQWQLFLGIWLLIAAVMVLPACGLVLLKMLPFDNKHTMAVTVDMPEGTSVENTLAVLQNLSATLAQQEFVVDYQLYAGTHAPITFNGLVRQYYLRSQPHHGEIAITLVANDERVQGSHDVAKSIRQLLLPIAAQYSAVLKVVEEPSGPPTLAPIVAEVYGPDQSQRNATANHLLSVFNNAAEVVDVDSSMAAEQELWQLVINQQQAQMLGVSKAKAQQALTQLLSQQAVGYVHDRAEHTPTAIIITTKAEYRTDPQAWLSLQVRNNSGQLVALSEFTELKKRVSAQPIYHKNLMPVTYVTADMAGETDSPLYAMFDAISQINQQQGKLEHLYTQGPTLPYLNAIKWDGEWKITYETFRDMGIAYAVGLLLIYLLIVAKFKDYKLPLLIMAPIPLTVIGILPGHWLFDAKFTAPSMIGMIALAGIIVRNSILLVDFIEQQLQQGQDLKLAVVASAQMRARPIVLTALAAMIGALFIVSDPIFKGLAVSLIFGMAVSSALTLVVIPIAYYRSKKAEFYSE